MSTPKISAGLYNLLADNDYIREVHFTKSGDHYLNIHELPGTGKFYGSLKLEQVYSHSVGDRRFYKMKFAANPPALIVATLSRDQVLRAYEIQEQPKSLIKQK